MSDIFTPNKQIRIAVIAANNLEDIELVLPIDIWRRAKFIVDVIVSEIKNSFTLSYSSLKVSGQFNLKHTNLIQYDAIYLPGGQGYKSFLTPTSQKYEGESKLHLSIKKFFQDESKWLVAMCASPIALMCILDDKRPDNLKFTSVPSHELIAEFKDVWVDKKVMIDQQVITAQGPACSFDLAFSVIEALTSLDYAKEVAAQIQYDFQGYSSYQEKKPETAK